MELKASVPHMSAVHQRYLTVKIDSLLLTGKGPEVTNKKFNDCNLIYLQKSCTRLTFKVSLNSALKARLPKPAVKG